GFRPDPLEFSGDARPGTAQCAPPEIGQARGGRLGLYGRCWSLEHLCDLRRIRRPGLQRRRVGSLGPQDPALGQADRGPRAGGADMIFKVINIYWYVLPLVLIVSLVYAASRHEQWSRIVSHAGRLCVLILGILLGTMVLLLVINTQV